MSDLERGCPCPRSSNTRMNNYRYVAELRRAHNSELLGQFTLTLDELPPAEWARFVALQKWQDPDAAAEARMTIQPHWDATSKAPCLDGLHVTARAPGREKVV